MDLKGITWVGHVYQKFEAMCLEVEEIMYQDTVKYVENQVQTVGSTVKKFYSDVIEDLLPPPSVDLVKGAVASNLPLEQNADVGIYKKPKIGIKEEAMKVNNEQLSESSLATTDLDKGAGGGQSFCRFHIEDTSFQPSLGDTLKGVFSDAYSKEYDIRSGHNQSSICMQKISKEDNLPPSEMSGAGPHMERGLRRASSSCELLDKIQEVSDDQVVVDPTSVTTEVASCKSFEEIYDELEKASKGASGALTSSPAAKNCDESESAHSSCSSLSAELNGICTNDGVVSLVGSFVNEDVQPSEFPDPGRSDYSTVDVTESNIDVEQGYETVQRVDNIQVEETCVLVNGDELCFVPCREDKHRPYKKKIQDAISSRMRSTRKHEYKQLAVWYNEDEKSKQQNAETKGKPSHGYRELEWELL